MSQNAKNAALIAVISLLIIVGAIVAINGSFSFGESEPEVADVKEGTVEVLEMTPMQEPEAGIVNPVNVAPEAEVPTVQSFAAQGLEFDLDEIRSNSAEQAAGEVPVLVPTPQTVAAVPASAVSAPAQAEQAAVGQAPAAQAGNVVIQPMGPQVQNPKYTVAKTETVSGWTLTWTSVAMKDRGDGKSYNQFAQETYPTWWAFNPAGWPLAPNVPNPLDSNFRVVQGQFGPEVPDGVEIPSEGIQNFCESVPDPVSKEFISVDCRVVVPPGHYVILSGDGEIPGIWKSAPGYGNAVIFWNVGNVEGSFIGKFRQVWYLKGRFWNGDTLPIAQVALSSHVANNMLDLVSPLNPNGTVNAGGNCSVREGCGKVFLTDITHSGDEPMLIATNSAVKQ